MYYTTANASAAAPIIQGACPVTMGMAALEDSDVLGEVALGVLDIMVPVRVVCMGEVVVVEESDAPVEAEALASAVSVAVICTGIYPPYGILAIVKPVVIALVEPLEIAVKTQSA